MQKRIIKSNIYLTNLQIIYYSQQQNQLTKYIGQSMDVAPNLSARR